VVAREATLQPVLERLRGSTRDYSEDERLDGGTTAPAQPPESVILPQRRLPFAAIAAFAGGATAVSALALAYVVFGVNGASPVAATTPSASPPVQAPAAPAKIEARVTPNVPVSHVQPVKPAPTQIATTDAATALPVSTSKGDRLDASTNPSVGASYDPLQSPLSLWGLSPTQAAIEGTNPALAAPGAPPAAAAADTAPPPPQQPAAPEHHVEQHHAAPVRHHVSHHHIARRGHHVRHRKPATTGAAASTGAQSTPAATDAAQQPAATKKFLGLFGG
jgi:hypothetical protein